MVRSFTLLTTVSLVVSLAACSQDNGNVQVYNKGHQFFGPDSTEKSAYYDYTPPKLHSSSVQYNPTPYEPDFRVREGSGDLYKNAPTQTSRVEAPAFIESRDISAPQESWSQPAPVERIVSKSRNYGNATFMPPVEANIVSGYGKRENGAVNDGINYLLPAGEPVYASADGTIAYVGNELKSYGHMVIVKHAGGYNSSYAHLGRATVTKDSSVQQGQIIGYVGQSGSVDKPQLHFAIRKGSEPVDPNKVLSKQLAAN